MHFASISAFYEKMSLFRHLISHPGFDRLKTLYNEYFPLEVHYTCAEWIEEQIKQSVNLENGDEERAASFMTSLCEKLQQNKAKIIGQEQMAIIEAAFQNLYVQMPFQTLTMFFQIRDLIMFLDSFLATSNDTESIAKVFDENESQQINEMLACATKRVLWIRETHFLYQTEMERFEKLEENASFAHENMLPKWEVLGNCKHNLETKIQEISNDLRRNIEMVMKEITKIQCIVVYKPLARWQRGQAKCGYGDTTTESDLDVIQKWFMSLADMIWQLRNVVEAVLKQKNHTNYEKIFGEVNAMLEFLVKSGFIIEHQPPQVIMKTAK